MVQNWYICCLKMFLMRRAYLSILALLLWPLLTGAQQIRTNYRSGGISHISTEYEALAFGDIPGWVRLEKAGFADGGHIWLLYLNLDQNISMAVPKGVKTAFNLSGGKFIRLDQIGEDSVTKPRMENGLFRNRFKYAAYEADMQKLLGGIGSVDIVSGWNPEDFIQASFPDNALASLLKRHYDAITEAGSKTIDLEATLAGHTGTRSSRMSIANPMVGRGQEFIYNIILQHLYYDSNQAEDIDLSFMIGTEQSYRIPLDAPVRFTLTDGSVIEFLQTRDDINFVCVFPTLEQVRRLADGIASVSIEYEGGILQDRLDGDPGQGYSFSQAVNQQLQLLMSVSPR